MICGLLMSDARRSCTAAQCSEYAEPQVQAESCPKRISMLRSTLDYYHCTIRVATAVECGNGPKP